MLCLIVLLVFVGIMMIPAMLSAMFESVILLAVTVILHFLVLKFIPLFKGRENMWMFITVLFTSIPINVKFIGVLNGFDIYESSWLILGILRAIICYSVMLSIEQLIMGVLTRLIWRKQYKNILSKIEE